VGIFSDTLQAAEVMWLGVLLVGFPLAFISSALENAGDGKLV
jgi:ABC-type spermidine/putrescine transport system permease subunit I